LVQKHFSGGAPPDPQIYIILLGDQYNKDCSSGKEFEDQNIHLWSNIHINNVIPQRTLSPLPPVCPGIPGL